MLFKNMYHMTKFNARCRKKLAFKFNKMRKTPCISMIAFYGDQEKNSLNPQIPLCEYLADNDS